MVKAGLIVIVLGAAAAATVPGEFFVDIKFAAVVAVQLVTAGALWGTGRANAKNTEKALTEVKDDIKGLKREVYPRLNNIEVGFARHEGEAQARHVDDNTPLR